MVKASRQLANRVLARIPPPVLFIGAFSLAFFALVTWDLLWNNGVDGGSTTEAFGLSVLSVVLLLLVVVFGSWQVGRVRRGERAQSAATFGVLVVLMVVFSAGESFVIAEAEHCNCMVRDRHGLAQAIWLAFDTVPILKINETVGWEEPQPLSAVTASTGSLEAPLRRWFPALAVRFAVGFILLTLAKVLFDLVSAAPKTGDLEAGDDNA